MHYLVKMLDFKKTYFQMLIMATFFNKFKKICNTIMQKNLLNLMVPHLQLQLDQNQRYCISKNGPYLSPPLLSNGVLLFKWSMIDIFYIKAVSTWQYQLVLTKGGGVLFNFFTNSTQCMMSRTAQISPPLTCLYVIDHLNKRTPLESNGGFKQGPFFEIQYLQF